MTILSQNTTDKNSIPAFYALKNGFKDWETVRTAPIRRIIPFIRKGGLANIKAKRIKEALDEIRSRQGRLDISFLKKLSDQQAYDYLRSLKGVGPKTASIVLLFSFNKPLMPVDTHIYRVAKRIGLLGAKVSVEKAHTILTKSTPPAIIHGLHINMIEHGRQVCKAPRPLCHVCGVRRICTYFKRVRRFSRRTAY